MNLKEKVFKCFDSCYSIKKDECNVCPYYNKEWGNCNETELSSDLMHLVGAYDFAWSQFKSTLEELIENNDGDVKMVCTFLYNLMRIREVDIGEGKYI